jgi:hypothetical protein
MEKITTSYIVWSSDGRHTFDNEKPYNDYRRKLKKFPIYELVLVKTLTVIALADDNKRGLVFDFCGGSEVYTTPNPPPQPKSDEEARLKAKEDAPHYLKMAAGLITELQLLDKTEWPHAQRLIDNMLSRVPSWEKAANYEPPKPL